MGLQVNIIANKINSFVFPYVPIFPLKKKIEHCLPLMKNSTFGKKKEKQNLLGNSLTGFSLISIFVKVNDKKGLKISVFQ